MQILLAIMILFQIIYYIIILDVILSWLTLFWLQIRPKFIADIIDPIYKNIKKIIPTSIWPVDFTPIVVIFTIIFIRWVLIIIFPDLANQAINLMI